MASVLEEYQPIAAIATTPRGVRCLQRLGRDPQMTLWVGEALGEMPHTRVYSGTLQDHLSAIWNETRALVFCLATGAVVRSIAPLLQNKQQDPAIVVIDEGGKYVISLCGGHQRGADRLAESIARQLGATAVLTGASNALGLPGADVLGEPFGWQRGVGDWNAASAAIARSEAVEVVQEVGWKIWQQHLPPSHPFVGEGLKPMPPVADLGARIWISDRRVPTHPEPEIPEIRWHPRVLWVGVGCERGTSARVIETGIERALSQAGLAPEAIAGLATIALKADEIGLLELSRDRHWPLKTFEGSELRAIAVPTPSAVVEAEVGTPSVAEAAALRAAGASEWAEALVVSKQICRIDGEPGAATVAISRARREYSDRPGQLWLVGTGPGSLELMTPAAQMAIAGADAIVGYTLYVDLVSPLLRPGQIVESLPITRERERAERAIALADRGLKVAVISSGDAGIYGMAGLVLEQLAAKGWDGKTPKVEVLPGISAVNAAAARVGTPLMHDFCAISLSDLLTPWEVIEKRLRAAAAADFVVALYNPKSRSRTEQIAIARQILLEERSPDTPVALVRSAYREDERIELTTLDRLFTCEIDMLTTVLIGNRSTRRHGDWIVTPRGYLGFDGPAGSPS
ncbi:MAG: precorrin-3B C(17)-methyltransferase [Cyanobacteria bacterium J007]|jgi:cobalt-precorrin 5A hydrolase/precorrin-3B C17-methyltransferase|nr:MAG: precorrin-3B C(17)-methyltransferase [Cyanobacteria bacterium J007]